MGPLAHPLVLVAAFVGAIRYIPHIANREMGNCCPKHLASHTCILRENTNLMQRLKPTVADEGVISQG
jgi:hypothetical protein